MPPASGDQPPPASRPHGRPSRSIVVLSRHRGYRTLIWERTRTFQRLRNTLREYFPGALTAYAGLELTSTDALELLVKAPTPQEANKPTRNQITAVLARHRRHYRDQKAAGIQAALREPQLGADDASGTGRAREA